MSNEDEEFGENFYDSLPEDDKESSSSEEPKFKWHFNINSFFFILHFCLSKVEKSLYLLYI